MPVPQSQTRLGSLREWLSTLIVTNFKASITEKNSTAQHSFRTSDWFSGMLLMVCAIYIYSAGLSMYIHEITSYVYYIKCTQYASTIVHDSILEEPNSVVRIVNSIDVYPAVLQLYHNTACISKNSSLQDESYANTMQPMHAQLCITEIFDGGVNFMG